MSHFFFFHSLKVGLVHVYILKVYLPETYISILERQDMQVRMYFALYKSTFRRVNPPLPLIGP